MGAASAALQGAYGFTALMCIDSFSITSGFPSHLCLDWSHASSYFWIDIALAIRCKRSESSRSASRSSGFTCGRQFRAWLGLGPGQYSSGGKQRLGCITKAVLAAAKKKTGPVSRRLNHRGSGNDPVFLIWSRQTLERTLLTLGRTITVSIRNRDRALRSRATTLIT